MFAVTANLTRGIQVLSGLDLARTPAFLSRIFQNLQNQADRAFTDDELTKLQTAFSLSHTELELAIETSEFIFLQAAYHSTKPAVLAEELEKLELHKEKITAVVDTWTAGGRGLVTKLRQQSVAPRQLSGIGWQLNLEMGEKSRANVKQPTSFWEFKITDSSANAEKTEERVQVEFNHDQLYEFYNQLETIQSQIDDLS